MTNSPERLQKALARAGLGSRRELEAWIAAGRVSVNGRTAHLGDGVGAGDRVRVDGKIVPRERFSTSGIRVLAYYKPPGIVCSRKDPEGRETVYDAIPRQFRGRWVSIGRLDLTTSGLLLFTNDGELANRLMHPSGEIDREYAVRVLGRVDGAALEQLREGVELDAGRARFDSIVDAGGRGANHWFRVVLREGRNREVHRLWESQGVKVSRLLRLRFGTVSLPRDKRPGQWWELEAPELAQLLKLVGVAPVTKPTPPARRPRDALRRRRTRARAS